MKRQYVNQVIIKDVNYNDVSGVINEEISRLRHLNGVKLSIEKFDSDNYTYTIIISTDRSTPTE